MRKEGNDVTQRRQREKVRINNERKEMNG